MKDGSVWVFKIDVFIIQIFFEEKCGRRQVVYEIIARTARDNTGWM